jgi:hypothetical protein
MFLLWRAVLITPSWRVNLEPKYRVTMLTREEWTWDFGTPPMVKGLIWFTDESRTAEGTGPGVYGQSVNRRLSIHLGIHATVFQGEVYAILACVHETETQDRPEKYISICSDSQAALKELQVAKSLLWCDSASRHWMISQSGMPWGYTGSLAVPDWEETKSLTSQRAVLVSGLLGLSLFWGSLGRIKEERWIVGWLWVCGPCGTQRQARELISGPNLATGAWLLSLNRTISRAVIGLLTGLNILRRHLHVMGLSNNHTCRKCGTEEETSVHILCLTQA